MQFVFKRDEKGQETVHVDGECVASGSTPTGAMLPLNNSKGITTWHIRDAIERADEAGFWEKVLGTEPMNDPDGMQWWKMSVTVDVPIADNVTLSVTTEEDES